LKRGVHRSRIEEPGMFLAETFKFVGGKIASAIIFIGVAAGVYWAYKNPEALKQAGGVVKLTVIWLSVVAALPWSSYLFMRPLLAAQARMNSAGAAAAASVGVIGAYSAADIALAMWLAGGGISGGLSWFVVIVGFIAAAAYNFIICESLARHVSG
jgi:hypothetical protein